MKTENRDDCGRTLSLMKCSGMTLLELMVAIAVFSLVAAAGYAGLSQGLHIQDKLKEQRLFWQELETVFNLMHSDLDQAVDRGPRTSTGSGFAAFIGHEHGGSAVYGYLLEFTMNGHASFREGPVSPFRRVAYRLHDGSLYRRTWPNPDMPYGAEPDEALLLEYVEDIRFRYLVSAGTWTRRWPQTAAPEGPTNLPKAVEMTLELSNFGPFRWLFHVG